MRIGLIGEGRRAAAREAALRAWPGGDVRRLTPEAAAILPDGLDVLFVAVPTADHYRVARAAARRGVHVFLEWPPATSVREGEAVVRLAEEAGVEAGVSRPLRFHPLFEAVPADWRAGVIVLRRAEAGPPAAGERPLADAVDLCCALARSSSVRRVDAEAVRGAGAWPEASAFSLRFHSGTYAQASLRRTDAAPEHHLFAAGPGLRLEADLAAENATPGEALETRPLDPARLLEAETHAFLAAIAARRAAPVSVLDGLHTMRLVERLMDRLR